MALLIQGAGGRMLVGYRDDLATPRVLGPFRDLAGSVGAELSRAVADGSERDRVLAALRTELTWPEHPTVLSQDGGYSLGAQAGEEPIRRLAGDAGYTRFRRVAETPFNIVYEVRP